MTDGLSASDVAVLTGNNERSNDGFGGGGWGAWIILFLIFAMFGWGGFGGWGGGFGGAGASGALTRADLCQDMNFQSLENGVRGIQQGLCDGFYAQNTTMLTGFNGIQNSLCQGFNGVTGQISNLGFQLQDCCCQTQRAIDGVNYNMATNTCALQNTMNTNTRDLLENQNSNTRAILDYLCQDKISTLQAENQSLKLAASQANQNSVIGARIDAATAEILRKTGADCPLPAYIVQPPQPVSFATNCSGQATFNNGWNNGCGYSTGCSGCGCGC